MSATLFVVWKCVSPRNSHLVTPTIVCLHRMEACFHVQDQQVSRYTTSYILTTERMFRIKHLRKTLPNTAVLPCDLSADGMQSSYAPSTTEDENDIHVVAHKRCSGETGFKHMQPVGALIRRSKMWFIGLNAHAFNPIKHFDQVDPIFWGTMVFTSCRMMYLLTTIPHPHGHWRLQELLRNRVLAFSG